MSRALVTAEGHIARHDEEPREQYHDQRQRFEDTLIILVKAKRNVMYS
jgi:hypothetical protein